MAKRKGGTAAAVCRGAALVFAAAFLPAGVELSAGAAASPPSSEAPAPPSADGDGGALPVQPVGGGGCIIGMNCGCIPHRTCPTPHPRPGSGGANQHNPPAPPNP